MLIKILYCKYFNKRIELIIIGKYGKNSLKCYWLGTLTIEYIINDE